MEYGAREWYTNKFTNEKNLYSVRDLQTTLFAVNQALQGLANADPGDSRVRHVRYKKAIRPAMPSELTFRVQEPPPVLLITGKRAALVTVLHIILSKDAARTTFSIKQLEIEGYLSHHFEIAMATKLIADFIVRRTGMTYIPKHFTINRARSVFADVEWSE